MKRKILGIGQTALGITLPSKWYRKFNLKKGDILSVTEDSGALQIIPEKTDKKELKGEINISGMNHRVISWILSSHYKKGYDELKIHFKDKEELKVIDERLKNLFTGFTIIDHTKDYVIIKSIASENLDDFNNILRRAFRVTINMAEHIYELLQEGKFEGLADLIGLEHTNNQLTNFCERLLNKGLIEKNSHFYYVILWNLEKICDDYKYICEDLSKHTSSLQSGILKLFADDLAYLNGYYDFFYDFQFRKLIELNKLRLELISELARLRPISHGLENQALLNHLHNSILKITDFSASIIGVHTD